MNRQERKAKQIEFENEVKELNSKGIKAVDIAELKKITRARVYQIIGLKSDKNGQVVKSLDNI